MNMLFYILSSEWVLSLKWIKRALKKHIGKKVRESRLQGPRIPRWDTGAFKWDPGSENLIWSSKTRDPKIFKWDPWIGTLMNNLQ